MATNSGIFTTLSPDISQFGRAKLPLRPDIWAARQRRPIVKMDQAFAALRNMRVKKRGHQNGAWIGKRLARRRIMRGDESRFERRAEDAAPTELERIFGLDFDKDAV